MQPIYSLLQQAAREIAATCPEPEFYRVFSLCVARSRELFLASPLVHGLSNYVREETRSNMGHGLGHAEKVALDAGVIAAVEGARANLPDRQVAHLVLLAHCAGLLHDIRRRHRRHAVAGAEAAREKLTRDHLLDDDSIDCVVFAIRNHEAFKDIQPPVSVGQDIVAGSLYDADKFRWGPDNFTHTVWKMIAAAPSPLPPARFLSLYPGALEYIATIKATFRTAVGKEFGPQFIDIGLEIGRRLLEKIQSEYKDCLSDNR
jgi:hypothetical protein